MSPARVVQSVLAPAGPQSASIERLWQLMLWVSVIVFVLVIAYIAIAVIRSPRASSPKGLARGVAASIAATVAVLFGLLVASVWTGHTIASLQATSAVTIAVTGHQWWWE